MAYFPYIVIENDKNKEWLLVTINVSVLRNSHFWYWLWLTKTSQRIQPLRCSYKARNDT